MARKTVLAFGELLWDLLPTGSMLGGAPYNFAFRVNNLGDRGLVASRLGRDELGERALAEVRRLGMETHLIQWDEGHPTGTVDVTLDEDKNPDYVINPRVAYDHMDVDAALLDAAVGADCLCFGTLAQRSDRSRGTLRALVDRAVGAAKLLDINLRKDCYDEASIRWSLQSADILKLNDDELRELADILRLSGAAIPERVEQLLDEWSLTHCLVTLGERGAYVASSDAEKVYVPGLAVDLVDPLGAGDAFSAGFVHLLLRGRPLAGCAALGNTLGAMVAEQEGATATIDGPKIREFLAAERARIEDPSLEPYVAHWGGDLL